MNWKYRCSECGKEFPVEPGIYVCDECSSFQKPGEPLRGILECVAEVSPKERKKIERLEDDLPDLVPYEFQPPIEVGFTPLHTPFRLQGKYGFEKLYIKDDTREPTCSYKDRASFLVAGFALLHDIKEIALASTGNAASSMAGIGAVSGINITVFLPKTAPIAKRIQVLQYGAKLIEVDGNYDKAFDECLAYCKEHSVMCRNTAYNPLTIEGKKTAAEEICSLIRPDHVFVPTGDGVILSGLYKGFEELYEFGYLSKMPTLWACQAEGSSAIARALENLRNDKKAVLYDKVNNKFAGAPHAEHPWRKYFEAQPSTTLADSISVDVPRNGYHALKQLNKYNGRAVTVSDDAILEAQKELSQLSGVFAEPSSAAVLAGFKKVAPELKKTDTIVLVVTGNGLKDIASAAKALGLQQ